jgi:Protein of unknown function (DUF1151)
LLAELKLGVEMIPDHDSSDDSRKDGEGLIMPRKPQNPCIESDDHKSLHRELMFNKKVSRKSHSICITCSNVRLSLKRASLPSSLARRG